MLHCDILNNTTFISIALEEVNKFCYSDIYCYIVHKPISLRVLTFIPKWIKNEMFNSLRKICVLKYEMWSKNNRYFSNFVSYVCWIFAFFFFLLCWYRSRRGLASPNISTKYEKYFFDDYLSADFLQKLWE